MLLQEQARSQKRILAVASRGGHWVQLLRLRSALHGCRVAYVTTDGGYRPAVPDDRFYAIRDANRWDKVGLGVMLVQLAWIVLRERPHTVITTGAAPGYFAIRLAGLLGAKTVWIDSIANAEELSLSGRLAAKHADLCLTQWPDLATADGPQYEGAVI